MSIEVLFAVLFVLGLSTLALLLWSWKTRDEGRRTDAGKFDDIIEDRSTGSDCPLCGEHLPGGTKVHSILYPGTDFGLMRIYGCRHCWEGLSGDRKPEHSRKCPYCGDTLPVSGYVMARVYQKPYRRTHVQVYGCTVCKPGRG